MMSRRHEAEFSRKIKALAYARTKRMDGGIERHVCDGCQCDLVPGQITFDHIKTVEEGGEGTLANCQVLCRNCDDVKTYSVDIPRIRKGDRQRDKHSGAMERRPTPLSGPPHAEKRALKERRSKQRQGDGKLPIPMRSRDIFGARI